MGGEDADRQRRVAEYTGRKRDVDLLGWAEVQSYQREVQREKGLLKDADSTAQFDDSSLDSDHLSGKSLQSSIFKCQ